jgi:xylulokinase
MLLALDLGTTNVKATVALASGKTVGEGAAPVQLLLLGADGVEQDIEEIWQAALSAIKQALQGLDASEVRAIGVSGQGGAMQLLDDRDRPLGRVLSWLDNRGQPYDQRLATKLGPHWFTQHIGHGRSGMAIGQWLRLRQENRALVKSRPQIGFVGDVIVKRLCGRATHDGTSCALTLLYNPRRRAYDEELLRIIGLHPQQLPVLQSVRQAAGGLLPEVARQTGLTAGLPVSDAVHDQYAAALGAGVIHAGDVLFGSGTAWVLLAVMDRWAKPVIDDAYVCHHVVDGLYGQILSLRIGGSAVNWARKLWGATALPDGSIDEQIGVIPPGSDGLCCWPFVTTYGASELAPGVKGRLSELQLMHTPAHILRAVIESLVYELNRHLHFLHRAGVPVKRIVMTGGAAQSRVTPQIVADVTGLPVACSPGNQGSLLGALMIARGLLQPLRSLKSLALDMATRKKTIKPGPQASFYQAQYRQYLKSLKPLMK